jgi:hypothetical protein
MNKVANSSYLSTYDSYGDTDRERIKEVLKMKKANNSALTLEKIKAVLDAYAQHVNLEDKQVASLAEITKAIAKPQDYQGPADKPKMTADELRPLLGSPDVTAVSDASLNVTA